MKKSTANNICMGLDGVVNGVLTLGAAGLVGMPIWAAAIAVTASWAFTVYCYGRVL